MIRSKIFHYATLSSTMDAAADLVSSEMMDELDYALVIADIQTKGRGQRGNNWHSEEGNLYLSIIFHHVDVSDPPFLSLQIALLVKEVLMQMGLNSEFIIQGNSIGNGWSLLIGKLTVVVSKIIDDLNLEIVKNKDLSELEQDKSYEYYVRYFKK